MSKKNKKKRRVHNFTVAAGIRNSCFPGQVMKHIIQGYSEEDETTASEVGVAIGELIEALAPHVINDCTVGAEGRSMTVAQAIANAALDYIGDR